ncbi:DUF1302 domain-containing protein [Burkholderia alba]|uniref:DUF1302 domain-containing protein n=1 Tax=Burkholderia alba TaxID=2683677 RepID=UPI002B0570F1|nr:DUF1302 domain-containing protein [Burkholderia alba]
MRKATAPRVPRCAARLPVASFSHWSALVCLVWGGTHAAHAGTIDLGNGIEAVWSLDASFTAGWRTKSPDPELIGIGDGGKASAATHSTDKNFSKGDNIADLLRVVGDIDVHKNGTGVVLRAKAWDNVRYSRQSLSFGAPSNGFVPDTRLDDSHFDTNLSKFKGVELLDAYAYSSFDLGESTQLKVRVGQHVVNFGESLFIPGVNQYQVLDVTALRQPGTLLKEAILPVPQISANLGLGGGKSIEAFYQFEWRRTAIDGCGTYWSSATALNCTPDSILVGGDGTSRQGWSGMPNFQFSRAPDRTPANSGQFGIAFKDMVDAIDTEFGAYFVNYAPKVPNLSAVRGTAVPHPAGSAYGLPSAATGLTAQDTSIYWDYSASNIKVFGLSASTVLGGWSTSAEASYTKGFPVQLSPVDSFLGLATGVGPSASLFGGADARDMPGYVRKNKSQIQISATKLLSRVLGAAGGTFVAEAAYQHWNGIGDPYTGLRYGRGFEFGAAQHASFGGACPAAATNANNCTQDGYFTSNAWGVRAMIELEYPNLIPNVVVKPHLFFSQDVKGWSADGVFSQGRYAITPGVKFELKKAYTLDLSYTHFNPHARFDSFHDRDFVAAVLTASF